MAYADDSMLLAEVSRSMDRLSVSASLNRDLARICVWCNSWGMRVNPNKTTSLVISRYRTVAPQYPKVFFVLDGAEVERVHQLKILGVTLDRFLTFEAHIRWWWGKPNPNREFSQGLNSPPTTPQAGRKTPPPPPHRVRPHILRDQARWDVGTVR